MTLGLGRIGFQNYDSNTTKKNAFHKGSEGHFTMIFNRILESLDFPRRFSKRLNFFFKKKQMNASGTVFGENHLRNTTRQTRLGCNRGDLPSGHEHVTYFYFLLFIKKIH